MNNRERDIGLGPKCMPVHASPPPPVLPSSGQELFTSLSVVLSKSRDPIHIHRPQIPLLISPQPLKNLPVFPSAHTYIHKHVFMEARGRHGWGGGVGIRITLNSKQRIVGPWRADGQSTSHMGQGSHRCDTQSRR